jgi:hypothetical protein
MAPAACVNMHPFSDTLREWETGAPVDCGPPWSREAIEAAIAKGAHKSATSAESIALIIEDVTYQVKAGYAEVSTWEELRRSCPWYLKVSPLAVVPQQNSRGRMILDLLFAVRQGQRSRGHSQLPAGMDVLQASVNDTTMRLAPEAPVKELGNVLPRLLNFMATVHTDEHKDLTDGYW